MSEQQEARAPAAPRELYRVACRPAGEKSKSDVWREAILGAFRAGEGEVL
ncbi:hypothetical protein CE91St41_28810 [Oscillospiraceae bacterium]|nr:hypothetical protein CE91St40_28810 [Oscillospiraceae bacterium]BDF75992.1 hypothetical protein CE91St41_28810 [Oscillospiraceae bacterium]